MNRYLTISLIGFVIGFVMTVAVNMATGQYPAKNDAAALVLSAGSSSPLITTGSGIGQTQTTIGSSTPLLATDTKIYFVSGISIDAKTGEVSIPEGMDLDEASHQFWDGLSKSYLDFSEAVISGYRAAQRDLPVTWGDDYLRDHPDLFSASVKKFSWVMINPGSSEEFEFGLRSDNVVVWRKVEK